MKICILDASFSLKKQDSMGMSARCILWQIQKHGIEIVNDPSKADYIFLSSVDPINAAYGENFKKFKVPIIWGGSGVLSPSVYLKHGDFAVCGDGENVIIAIKEKKDISKLSNVLTKDKLSVDINQFFPFSCPPIQQEDGSFSVWCGRGCKNKCYFCQTGWALKYQESDCRPENLARGLLKKGCKISYLSNDVLQHSFYDKLPPVAHGSYSLKYMRERGLPPARLVRIGVEGISARLRTFVNKPISQEDLVKCTSWLNLNHKGVRWFLIVGLPNENKEDWDELKDSIMLWKGLTPKGVLELNFTAWIPQPATPMATLPLNDEYCDSYQNFKDWFFAGVGFSSRIKLYNPKRPENRLIAAMCSMDLTKDELYNGGYWGGNSVVNYPYKIAAVKLSEKIRS